MILPTPIIAGPEWPENWLAGPADCADALACFDTLAGLEPEFMIGRWRGAGLPTAHPLDGVLEALGWYGKAFESVDRVHPLLFRVRSGAVIPLDPAFMPVRAALRWPALTTELANALGQVRKTLDISPGVERAGCVAGDLAPPRHGEQ